MAEPALKLAPQPDTAAAPGKRPAAERRRRLVRLLLLVVLPAIVLLVGVGLYLSGGRYISTDNAYIGAQKVLITPDISGKVARAGARRPARHRRRRTVRNRSRALPARLTAGAEQLDTVRTEFANLKSNLQLAEPPRRARRRTRSTSSSATSSARPRCCQPAPARRSTSTIAKAALVRAELQLAAWQAAAQRHAATSCSAIPICRSSNSPPICRPRRRSTRPSATSITPC